MHVHLDSRTLLYISAHTFPGDVAYLAEDVKAVGAMTIDTCEVANLIKPSLGETEEEQKQQSLNIRYKT